VAGAEVVEVDAVASVEQAEAILIGPLRQECLLVPWNIGIFSMFAFVFSCVTISTFAGKNMLLPT
jgi:hypothetical protein